MKKTLPSRQRVVLRLALALALAPAVTLAAGAPDISAIADQRTFPNRPTRVVPFIIGDAQTPAENLIVSGASANVLLVPNGNVVFGGSGSNRTVTVTPTGGNQGTALITISVQNAYGGTTNRTFMVTVAGFTDVGASLGAVDGASIAWGDHDNDGHLDLLVTGSQTSRIYHNNGDGTFSLVATPGILGVMSGAAAWGDYNNDGRLDILLTGYYNINGGNANIAAQIYRNDGSNTFTLAATPLSYGIGGSFDQRSLSLGWADYDNDGRLDALFAGWPYTGLFHNNGGNSFTDSGLSLPGALYSSVAWGDFNNDGNSDFLLMYGYCSSLYRVLYQNDGRGYFSSSQAALAPPCQGSLECEDFNNDGKLDVAATGSGYYTSIFAGQGNGGFSNILLGQPGTILGSVAWGDMDNDGWPDLILTSAGGTQVFHNNGDGSFSSLNLSLPGAANGGIAIGDYDNDGVLDIAIAGGGVVKVFHNDGAMPNTPPRPLANLTMMTSTNFLTLAWVSGTDAEQTGGLSYNVCVGTTPGGIDVVGPMADRQTGFRRLPALGNAGLALNRKITNMKPGTYYWSMQSIDHAFAGSAFAPEQSFTLLAPVFTVQPITQIIGLSSNVSFTARAEGTLPISYRWYHNGTGLTDGADGWGSTVVGAATTNLVISSLQPGDSGAYTLVASNLTASTTSAAATLTVAVPPHVTDPPTGRSIPLGMPTTFSVSVYGTPLYYQWRFNGVDIPGATDSSYTITAVTPDNVGTYNVVVTNIAGSDFSSGAALTLGTVAGWGLATSGQTLPPAGLSNVIAIASGTGFSLALRQDGTVVAWGTSSATYLPASLTNVVAIAAGSTHALAVRSDGSMVGWGGNLYGQASVPLIQSNAIAVSGGNTHSLALRADGTVFAWGAASPATTLPPNLNHVIGLDAGSTLNIALREGGSAVSWGVASVGSTSLPFPVPLTLSNATAVSAGTYHYLGVTSLSNVIAWGVGGAADAVPGGLGNVVAVEAAGGSDSYGGTSLALRADGSLVAWGTYANGLTNVPTCLTNVVAMASSLSHCLILENDGTPQILRPPVGGTFFKGRSLTLRAQVAGCLPMTYQWLCNGTNVPDATNSTFVISALVSSDAGAYRFSASNALGTAVSVAAPVTIVDAAPFFYLQPGATNRPFVGSPLSLGASVGGSGPMFLQWQFNGQNLAGETRDTLTFPRVRSSNAGTCAVIATNSFGAITSLVSVVQPVSVAAWGCTGSGQQQTNVPVNLSNAVAIAANYSTSLALRDNGTVVAWGGSSTQTNVPATVTNVTEIAAGNSFHLALKASGAVVGWGSGLGSLSTVLPGLSNIVSIEADSSGAAFLRADGSVARYATNGASYVLAPTNVVALAPFYNTFGALRADGTAFVIDGSAQPPAASNVIALAMQRYYGALLKRHGTTQGWGSPAPPNLTNIAGIAANAAVRLDGTVLAWPDVSSGSVAAFLDLPPSLTSVGAVDTGASHALALLVARDFPVLALPDALDTAEVAVSSRNSPQWFGQTSVTHDGTGAAQSAEIGDNASSSFRLWVCGPVTISFWWKVSSETNRDLLSFAAGGIALTNISGETDWQQCVFPLPAGNQILTWTYAKNGSGAAGRDAGWVAQVQLIPQPPSILSQPASCGDVVGGIPVIFSVSATGTPPLAYYWRQNGATIAGATGSSLLLPSVTRADSGLYSVVVTNAGGLNISSNANLTVHVPQRISAPVLDSGGAILLRSTDADGGILTPALLGSLQVQVSSNLSDWSVLPAALTLTNGILHVQDPNAAGPTPRFYRIMESW